MSIAKKLTTPYLLQALSIEKPFEPGMKISQFLRCEYMGAAEYEFGGVPEAIYGIGARLNDLAIFEVSLSGVQPSKAWANRSTDLEFCKQQSSGVHRSESGRWTIKKAEGGWQLSDSLKTAGGIFGSLKAAKEAALCEEMKWTPPRAVFLLCAPAEVEDYSSWIRALAGGAADAPRIKRGCRLERWVNGDYRLGDTSRNHCAWLDLANFVAFTVQREVAEALLQAIPQSVAFMEQQKEAAQAKAGNA